MDSTILQGQSQQDEEEQEEGGSSPIARKSKGNKKGEAKPEGGAGKGKRQIEEGEEKKEGLLVASPPFALVDRLEADLALTAAHVQGWRVSACVCVLLQLSYLQEAGADRGRLSTVPAAHLTTHLINDTYRAAAV